MPKKITSKSNKQQSNQKFIIIAIALSLAVLGYVGYRSLLTTPDINRIDFGGGSGGGGKDKNKLMKVKDPNYSGYGLNSARDPNYNSGYGVNSAPTTPRRK